MSVKKVILILTILFLFTSFLQTYTLLQITSSKITGIPAGTVNLCYNTPPQITPIPDRTAYYDYLFTYQVRATDPNPNTDLTYEDNTSLFNITPAGLISFTPQASDNGTHSIRITVEDNSGCSNNKSTEIFLFTISKYTPPAEEAPTPTPTVGGGGSVPALISFQLSQELLKVTLKQSQKLEKKITITNKGKVNLKIEITNPISDLISLSPSTFNLPVGQTKEIILIFNPQQDASLGVHSGQITFKGTHLNSHRTKTLSLIMEIESEIITFDASLDILKKTLFPGEELKATITVFNLGRIIPADVTLTYLISDFKQAIIYQEKETLTLEEQISFSKTIPLSSEIQPGQYLFSLNVQHADSFATASDLFTIELPPSPLAQLAAPLIQEPSFFLSIPIMFFLIIIVLIILFITLHFIRKKIKKPRIIIKPDTSKLKRKLSLLKESYQKGYIREKTYQKAKSKLEKLIRKKH